jgi:hypothetical protein
VAVKEAAAQRAKDRLSDSDDPPLSTGEAASLLGCDEHGVFVLMKHNQLEPEPKAHGKRLFLQFRQSKVEAAKPYYRRLRDFQEQGFHDHPTRGKEYIMSRAAEERKLPLHLLRRGAKPGGLFPGAELHTEKLDPPPTGSIPWEIVREKELLLFEYHIKAAVREAAQLNRDRWKTVSEICTALGIDDRFDQREIFACAKCWVKLGSLPHKQIFMPQTGKVPATWRREQGRTVIESFKDVKRFRLLDFYDFPKFKQLWERDFVRDGAKRLKQLVSEHGGRCPALVVSEELKKLGLVGHQRIGQVAKAARIVPVHNWGVGAKNQIVYVPAGARRPDNPVEVMRSVLSNGPLSAGDGLREGRLRGLTPREVYAAVKKLGVPLQANDRIGAHAWQLPGNDSASTPTPSRANGIPRPRWDKDTRSLWLGGDTPIKTYNRPAEFQTTILASFEEQEWRPRIDDPLPPGKLVEALDSLNRTLKSTRLKFHGDGTGTGIRWSIKDITGS